MPLDKRPVAELMTPLPHTIGVDQPLSAASRRMWQLGVRHLPVLDGGKLVGVLSERDLAFATSLSSVDPEEMPVGDAMSAEPLVVGPEMPLGVVARTMAEKKVGCVIVVDGRDVVGIITTTDALAILADVLSVVGSRPGGLIAADVRKRIRDEHQVITALLDECGRLANRVLAGESDAEGILSERARELYHTLLRHIDLEDAVLAPVLRQAGAEGERLARALTEEHQRQRYQLRSGLASLETGWIERLARSIQSLVPAVRKDMEHEEKDLLQDSVLEQVKRASQFPPAPE